MLLFIEEYLGLRMVWSSKIGVTQATWAIFASESLARANRALQSSASLWHQCAWSCLRWSFDSSCRCPFAWNTRCGDPEPTNKIAALPRDYHHSCFWFERSGPWIAKQFGSETGPVKSCESLQIVASRGQITGSSRLSPLFCCHFRASPNATTFWRLLSFLQLALLDDYLV